ncbi:lipopolysaccharide biosynthesis protein [soil metagenome]
MKLSQHLGKISWSLGDKALYVGYGLVQLLQIKALNPDVYGVFSLLVALNTWIMLVSDGSALQGVIQFGVQPEERRRVNSLGMVIHVTIVGMAALLIYLLQQPLSSAFHEPRFVVVAQMLPLYVALSTPRMFCLKILYRDMRMRDLFVTDVVWFGVRTSMTVWALQTDSLHTLGDIIRIDFVGMAASSIASILITRKDMIFGWEGTVRVWEYVRFGIPLALATALNSTPRQLDVFVIQAYFGAAAVGVYNPAKNLYRFFEQAFDAVFTLLYPASVRLYAQHREEDLQKLVTKAMSFTIIPVVVALVVLEFGGSSLIVPLLGQKYAAAVGHFNVLILAALFMPFGLMASVITAMGHSTVVVRYSAVGLILSIATLVLVGVMGWEQWIALGLVVNTAVVGVLCVAYVRRHIHFPWSMMLRAFSDVRNVALPARKGGKT